MMLALAWREALPTSALRTGGTRQCGGDPVFPRINIWLVIIVVFIVLVLLGVVTVTH